MNSCRFGKATLIAPLAVYPVLVVPMLFSQHTRGYGPLIGFFAVVVAYAGMFFVGFPIIAVLEHYRTTRWWQVTLAGAIGGGCMGPMLDPSLIPFAMLFGAVVAGTFWLIAYLATTRRLRKLSLQVATNEVI